MIARAVIAWAVSVLSVAPIAPLGLDRFRPVPDDNPLTAAKIDLGRRLFNDRRLSRDGTVACATCHNPGRAFTDGRRVARGVDSQTGARNAPTLINRAYGTSFFWDGRAETIEQQVLQPLLDTREMATTRDAAVKLLRDDRRYAVEFHREFGREAQWADLGRALASYVRTIRSGNSRYDRFQHGQTAALTGDEQRGMHIFLGRGNCWVCHAGPNLSDEQFHNTGVAFQAEAVFDEGRFFVTKRAADRAAFKTPTLRDVSRTAPYMHDGSFATLEHVVEFYNHGGNPNPSLDREIHPLNFSHQDAGAVVAFLRTLSGRVEDGR